MAILDDYPTPWDVDKDGSTCIRDKNKLAIAYIGPAPLTPLEDHQLADVIVKSVNLLPQLVTLLKECEEFIFTSADEGYDTVTKMADFENRIQATLDKAKV